MRRSLPLLLSCILLAGCATHSDDGVIRPQLALIQLVGPSDLGFPQGRVDVQYALQVKNNSSEPITLKRIMISSVGSGAYLLRRDELRFNETFPPEQVGQFTFWAKALARNTRSGQNEPVTVRLIVYFDSPMGSFHQILQQDLSQFPRGQN